MSLESAIFAFFGASALLVFAMGELTRQVQVAAGPMLRRWVQRLSRNRFTAFGIGTVLGALLNSSNAVTMLFVALTNSRMVGLEQVLPALLGASVGSTLVVFAFALKVRELGFGLLLLGAVLGRFVRHRRAASAARMVVAAGLLFLSLALLEDGVMGLETFEIFRSVLSTILDQPFIAFLVSALLTGLVSSSAAVIAFGMAFAHWKGTDVGALLPWVLGANVGTTAASFLLAIGQGPRGEQAALAHFLSRALGALVVVPFLRPFAEMLRENIADPSIQVAVAHAGFNTLLALILLPLFLWVAKVIRRVFPIREEDDPFRFLFLTESALDSPELALAQAKREVVRLSEMVETMFDRTFELLGRPRVHELEEVKEMDQLVDFLNRGIKMYLTKISRSEMTPDQSQREFQLLLRTNDLENIGDILDRNVIELVRKKMDRAYRFSDEGWNDLRELHRKVAEVLRTSNAFFGSQDRTLLVRTLLLFGEIEDLCLRLSERHVHRLHQQVQQSLETTSVHWDLIGYLQRIAALSVNVCRVFDSASTPGAAVTQ